MTAKLIAFLNYFSFHFLYLKKGNFREISNVTHNVLFQEVSRMCMEIFQSLNRLLSKSDQTAQLPMWACALRVGRNKAGRSLAYVAASVVKESFRWTINTLETLPTWSLLCMSQGVTGGPLRDDGHLS